MTAQRRTEHIPGPMPFPMRAQLTRDNEQDADTAARAIARYVALERAHLVALYHSRGTARQDHARAVRALRAAYGAELEELTA